SLVGERLAPPVVPVVRLVAGRERLGRIGGGRQPGHLENGRTSRPAHPADPAGRGVAQAMPQRLHRHDRIADGAGQPRAGDHGSVTRLKPDARLERTVGHGGTASRGVFRHPPTVAEPVPRDGKSSASENLVRVVKHHGAGDVIVQRPVLPSRYEEHERSDQRDEAQEAVDDAAGDLAQAHEPEAGHPVGFRPPAAHPEHLQRRGLPVAPDDEAPDDVSDAQRDDGERNGQEISADATADAGQLGTFRQEQVRKRARSRLLTSPLSIVTGRSATRPAGPETTSPAVDWIMESRTGMVQGMTGKLTIKGRQTRQRIVAAAAELMFEGGVAGTTMEDVRAAAGVSSSQIYHYFADK